MDEISYKWALAIIAMLISATNVSFYLKSVLANKTKPHMFTWIIWAVVMGVASFSQLTSGAGAGGFYTLYLMLVCAFIAIISYFKGIKDIAKSDVICLLTCLIAIMLWPLTKTPLYSIIIITLVDLLGFYPTVRKSYLAPHEENIILFAITIITYSLSIFALENYNFITIIYPATMVVASIVFVTYLATRRHKLGHKIIK